MVDGDIFRAMVIVVPRHQSIPTRFTILLSAAAAAALLTTIKNGSHGQTDVSQRAERCEPCLGSYRHAYGIFPVLALWGRVRVFLARSLNQDTQIYREEGGGG